MPIRIFFITLFSFFICSNGHSNSWQETTRLSVKFREGQKVVAYLINKNSETMTSSSYEATLALCPNLKAPSCQATIIGFRDPNIGSSLPFGYSKVNSIRSDLEGNELLKVTSIYQHGYTEEVMQIYNFNQGELKLVWSQVVNSVSPMGEEFKREVQFDFKKGQLNLIGQGKTQKWKWFPKRSEMILINKN